MCVQFFCCRGRLNDVNVNSDEGKAEIKAYKVRATFIVAVALVILALGLCAYYQVGSMANAFSHSGTLAMIYTPTAFLGLSLLAQCLGPGLREC
jgi:hypothetical protein